MRRCWKRFVAAVLTAVMLLGTLPTQALAGLLDNDPAYNAEILEELTALCGSEDEAQQYYALLQQYNLLDEDGDTVESWTVSLNGEPVTLDELRELLAGDYDPAQAVMVDGSPLTLGDLDTILQIEDKIAYLREKYFTPHKWTAEQNANLASLENQIRTQGIGVSLEGEADALSTVGPSGVDHSARVSVSVQERNHEVSGSGSLTVTFTLTGQGPATFWCALVNGAFPNKLAFESGSMQDIDPKKITLNSDGESSSLTVYYDGPRNNEEWIGKLAAFLRCYDLTGALFSNGQNTYTVSHTLANDSAGRYDTSAIGGSFITPAKQPDPADPQYGTFTPTGAFNEEGLMIEGGNKIKYHAIFGEYTNATDYTASWQCTSTGSLMVYHPGWYSYLDRGNNSGGFLTPVLTVESVDPTRYYIKNVSVTFSPWHTDAAPIERSFDYGDTAFTASNKTISYELPDLFANNEDAFNTLYISKVSITFQVREGQVTDANTPTMRLGLTFEDLEKPTYQSVEARPGTYQPGDQVPIVVTFSEPVHNNTAYIVVNGTKVCRNTGLYDYSWEDYASAFHKMTFLYTVKEVDDANLTLNEVHNFRDLVHEKTYGRTNHVMEPAKPNQVISGVTLNTCLKKDAVSTFTAQVDNSDPASPKLVAQVQFVNDGTKTQNVKSAQEGERFYVDGMTVRTTIGGQTQEGRLYVAAGAQAITGSTVTATFDIPPNDGETALDYPLELIVDGQPVLGRLIHAPQDPAKFVTENDLAVSTTVKDKDGEDYTPVEGVIYLQDGPSLQAHFALAGSGYAYGNPAKTAGDDNSQAEKDAADFIWSSSDTAVATIDKNGGIHPVKGGTVSFTLTARNGGVEGKEVSLTTAPLTLGLGLTPFLNIPEPDIQSVGGRPVTVYWTSNLCDKADTTFHISVTRDGTEVFTKDVSGTKAAPAASCTIPAEVLTYDYKAAAVNTFTVTVWATYNGVTHTKTATIDLQSKPAHVALKGLDSYYITDTAGQVNIGWTVESFDQYSTTEQLFQFQVKRNDRLVADVADPGGEPDASGAYTGSHTLDIENFQATSDPTSYRQVYTVTIKAKNGTDSTWSYDSFLLYVYDADALRLMVDGKAAGDSLTMSNVERIQALKDRPEDILALDRDIYLKNMLSVNHGEYAWGEIADQMVWKSEDSSVASVNYQQGTLFENIERFSTVSYRPTTEFGLSGLKDGSTTISATHKITGISDSMEVTVETLKDKLYLFQCYPQAVTRLTFREYTNADKTATKEVTVYSDGTGTAAHYAQFGIASDVYCQTRGTDGEPTGTDGKLYTGTFYLEKLKSGESDWTRLERYPCNNLELRQAAYAYLYVKDPDGTPFANQTVTVRAGVYVNGTYRSGARFALNGQSTIDHPGNQDNTATLGLDGRLEITMDQTQWGLPSGGLRAGDRVEYVFEISCGNGYYPRFVKINASTNQNDFIGQGEAVVNMEANASKTPAPYIAIQTLAHSPSEETDLRHSTGRVGLNDRRPTGTLETTVLWWDEAKDARKGHNLRLLTDAGVALCTGAGEASIEENSPYPFTDHPVTVYTVNLNEDTLSRVAEKGRSTAMKLEYQRDGQMLRQEALPFRLCNMIGTGEQQVTDLQNQLKNMGGYFATNADTDAEFGDDYVMKALNFLSGDEYTTEEKSVFSIQLAPTSDPTKFLGFIELNVTNVGNNVTGAFAGDTGASEDFDYGPGLNETLFLTKIRNFKEYKQAHQDDFNKAKNGQGVRDFNFEMAGYLESIIYFDETRNLWDIKVLSGGFSAGGGVNYSWFKNFFCGPVPVTASVTIGGMGEVSMDALSVAYYNQTQNYSAMGTDFLTQLRIYLYIRFFVGVGVDYAIIAFKLGVFGQISMDMRFQWLNRPYMDSTDEIVNLADGKSNVDKASPGDPAGGGNLSGQHIKISGLIGLELYIKILFVKYEKVLCSASFDFLDEGFNAWDSIQDSWAKNQAAYDAAIGGLLKSGNASLLNMGGQQMVALNAAPTLEDRSYLTDENFYRQWGDRRIVTFSLDPTSGLESVSPVETGTYPYANPMVSDDGALVVYLTDQENTDTEKTRAAFAVRNDRGSYDKGTSGEGTTTDKNIISDAGFGDSQLSLSGTKDFAVAAWARQSKGVADLGSRDTDPNGNFVLTDADQALMLNSTEAYAAVWDGANWSTVRLSDNTTPDLAPVAASATDAEGNKHAVVFWRSALSSGKTVNNDGANYTDLTNFDQRDAILYSVYDSENNKWGAEQTLYNGTSGNVKGIVADMLTDGTTAVAYTLDTDGDGETTADREIVYAVVNKEGNVVTNVRPTTDAYLDENPQLSAVTFPLADGTDGAERFVLGWYTEQSVASDSARTLDGGAEAQDRQNTVSDIRLLEFGADGVTSQLLPDSISKAADAADVTITPNFRFTKNAKTINDLSILWVERAEGTVSDLSGGTPTGSEPELEAEKDVLKGVKFYTFGDQKELIGFTGAVDVAEMGDGTLIDHFDAYVSNRDTNEIKAVILGTTYGEGGEDGTTTKTLLLADGETTIDVRVPTQSSAMYTATETYQDKIEVPAVLADYDTVLRGGKTQLAFTVENRGIHAIEKLTFTVGDTKTVYGEKGELNLLPGQSIQLYADYQVPADRVVDAGYTVQAEFSEVGATGSAERMVGGGWFRAAEDLAQKSGTVYLDLPDVSITNASIVKEEDGQRTIQLKLNNRAHAALAGRPQNDPRQVRLSFFTDATCETPFDKNVLPPIVISDEADLKMIDEGGYATQLIFNVGEYVKGDESEAQDIPEGGVTVYVKAEVLAPSTTAAPLTRSGGELVPQGEPITSDNFANLLCENLQVRREEDVTITSELASQNGSSVVTVTLQNNRLTTTTTGNVIVTLLDANGKPLASQQSYKYDASVGQDNGLVTLEGEKKTTLEFHFDGLQGSKVQVTYSDADLGHANNADLANLSLTGASLTRYEEEDAEGNITISYEGSCVGLDNGLLSVVPEDLRAAVTVNGKPCDKTMNVPLQIGENLFKIEVTSKDGTVTKTYTLTVNNTAKPATGGSTPTTYPVVAPAETDHGTVTVSPKQASRGGTVTITAKPDEGYQVGTVTVTKPDGGTIAVTDKGDGRYTFTMPGSKVEIQVTFVPKGSWTNPFRDVPSDAWYYDAVEYVHTKGMMTGTGPETFSPEASTTRGMIATILWRLEGSPVVEQQLGFDDVEPDAWYTEAVRWAVSEGIAAGYGNGSFGPGDIITREQLATILHRYAMYKDYGTTARADLSKYTDAAQVGAWAMDAMRWANAEGLVNGTSATTLMPGGFATRCQAAVILMRFCENIK